MQQELTEYHDVSQVTISRAISALTDRHDHRLLPGKSLMLQLVTTAPDLNHIA